MPEQIDQTTHQARDDIGGVSGVHAGPSAPAGQGSLQIEVFYGAAASAGMPGKQFFHSLTVPAGTTVHQAIRQSGILEAESAIDLSRFKVGIHGKLKALDAPLRDGDRIEIYRPLQVDPMAARRRRATLKR